MTRFGLDPRDIDPSFVPRVRPTVGDVELDGETVLYDEATGRLHHLDPNASVVWSFFDGATSLAELVGELSEAYGVETAVIEGDVVTLVRHLGWKGVLEGVGPVDDVPARAGADHGAEAPRLIAESPGAAGYELDRRPWAAATTFRIGPWHIGVRSSTPELDALLRRALASHVVDDVDAPANYSVCAAPRRDDDRSPRSYHFLYRSDRAVVRSRTLSRLLRALFSYLSGHLEDDGHLLRVRALPLLAGAGAVLAPRELLDDAARIEPWLRREGFRVLDLPHATVDPATGELVVAPPALALDPGVVEELEGHGEAALPDPGRYPVRGWALLGGALPGPLAEPTALAWGFPALVEPARLGVRRAFAELGRLLERTPLVALPPAPPRELARRLAELATGSQAL